ncbi:hypothetical protein SPRG_03170 [Saprolegnia parasitica CBS 223.65]|uniref:SUN domain-containing protein n=1 Tax=Saprolegnia parasitica (strain CBS 223.65) TaxID=695850 RepID=A0A067CRR6_SAPPC|nr:hypothetical protein SPRG_03170 [Saprolegnia parasitica CBS 223.65]KDO31955.1 hypothetical protein SPRG_03170 [Saprolegnia parasitica CBS 223.65]|eukprot:XP_012197152.1 hypothetical protein SPRG_03170 [Saprolegnia parasitica CBS 223.65]
MRGRLVLVLAASLLMVLAHGIVAPGEVESSSSSSSSGAATPSPQVHHERAEPDDAMAARSSDIAENIAEIDIEVDRGLYNPSSNSIEVQDSDGGQRQNYASKARGSVNLLVPDKDRYMLIPCSADKKWIVISLSEDIHAEAIAIANYEKFSSMTKEFLVLGSINYPTDTWVVLGHFNALHKNGEQLFNFQEKHHVRYLKLRLNSHYGAEYYCTMSQIKVYGRTFTQVISQLERSIHEEPIAPPAIEPPAVEQAVPSTTTSTTTSDSMCPVPDAVVLPWELEVCEPLPISLPPTEKPTMAHQLPVNASATNATSASHAQSSKNAPDHPSPLATTVLDESGNHTKAHDHGKTTNGSSAPSSNGVAGDEQKGLDNFYIRMSKKIQALEANQSSLERTVSETLKPAAVDAQVKLALLSEQMTNLTKAVHELRVIVDSELEFLTSSNEKYMTLLEGVYQENLSLRNEMLLVWDVITTMKAGILVAIVLSAIFRCLTGCHRRAARREWLRRMESVDETDDEVDPLTQEMDKRVDRTLRFGRSLDDGAIQRNTLYRRVLHGFRQHHVKSRLRLRKPSLCGAPVSAPTTSSLLPKPLF